MKRCGVIPGAMDPPQKATATVLSSETQLAPGQELFQHRL